MRLCRAPVMHDVIYEQLSITENKSFVLAWAMGIAESIHKVSKSNPIRIKMELHTVLFVYLGSPVKQNVTQQKKLTEAI